MSRPRKTNMAKRQAAACLSKATTWARHMPRHAPLALLIWLHATAGQWMNEPPGVAGQGELGSAAQACSRCSDSASAQILPWTESSVQTHQHAALHAAAKRVTALTREQLLHAPPEIRAEAVGLFWAEQRGQCEVDAAGAHGLCTANSPASERAQQVAEMRGAMQGSALGTGECMGATLVASWPVLASPARRDHHAGAQAEKL